MGKTATPRKKARKYKAFHAHGCEKCARRYSDTCATPAANGRCHSCRAAPPGGWGEAQPDLRPLWDRDFDPRPCCRRDSRAISDSETLERFGLAGPGPWFKCLTCARTHPYNPTR